jgi:hypothetical protein
MNRATVIALIDALEAELNNGGFDQFFFNDAGGRTAETIEALKRIGASHTASLVQAAADKFPGGTVPTDRKARQKALGKVSPESDAFEEQDEAFYEYQDDLAALASDYEG